MGGQHIDDYQRLLARMQNGDIQTFPFAAGDDRKLYVRQLGHARNTLHMFPTTYFDVLFAVRRETHNGFASYLNDDNEKVEWSHFVDAFSKRKSKRLEDKIQMEVERKTRPRWNIGMGRPKTYPYSGYTGRAQTLPFRSKQWDDWGTLFFSITINRENNHWVGVIVERKVEQQLGIMRFYDLYCNSTSDERRHHTIMEAIGVSLNVIGTGKKDDFLAPFKWEYVDVMTADNFNKNGGIQKDGWSCGIIWMMILWFVVTNEKAPTYANCHDDLWLSEDQLINFRIWLGYSILMDRFWFQPQGTHLLLEYFDALEQPTADSFSEQLPLLIFSKLPPTPPCNARTRMATANKYENNQASGRKRRKKM
jgi:hypothetical protein